MKFEYYVMSGEAKQTDSLENWNKAWEEFKEALKPTGLEMLFYGSPFGTHDGGMCVLKGNVADFEAVFGDPKIQFGMKIPLTNYSTTLVLV